MDDIFIDQQPIVGTVKDFLPFGIVKVNTKEADQLWDHMVRTWHYLGYQSMIGPRIKYLVLYRDRPIAALSFTQAALKIGARDSWIGLDTEHIRKMLPHMLNNNRFLILPWVKVKNLASFILSRVLHMLKKDWLETYHCPPYAIETFIDISRYPGTCYKAANWHYVGETLGYGKVGKSYVYHGNRKGVFFYILNAKFHEMVSQYPQRQPNPKLGHARIYNMMLNIADWSPELFPDVEMNEQSVAGLGELLNQYMGEYETCYTRKDQQDNGETYLKGLLSDLDRKSIEPIALRYRDVKAVRTLQLHLKDSPWDDTQMKRIYQNRIFINANDPKGMITVDGSDHAKKGTKSAGIQRQYCGSKGKTENCQAGVYIGYAGTKGYGLLDSRLYLPMAWFDDEHKKLWEQDDIPKTTVFRTKPQLALDMIQEALHYNDFKFKWVGCDGAFGCDSEFRKGLPKSTLFFADVHNTQRVFMKRPTWAVPAHKGRGRAPTIALPSIAAIPVADVAADNSVPWETITLMEGAKGPVITQVKFCRIVELQDKKDADELWLYIRKYEDGSNKYAVTNAPLDIDINELHHAATLRWPIEQCFQECKSFLGMSHYETRSYRAWHRHMLLVMVAHLFVLEVRVHFKKKNETLLTMPQALKLIIAAISCDPEKIRMALRDVAYYKKNNAKAYRSHRKKKLAAVA